MDNDHMDALRRLGEAPAGHGGRPPRMPGWGKYDGYPPETVLVFRRSGSETKAAVKLDEVRWRVTGHRRLRTWDGMLRAIGHGYELFLVD